jgi:AraC family transcriptional regulator
MHQAGFEVNRSVWKGSAEFVSLQIPPDILSELMNRETEPLCIQTHMPLEDKTLASLIITMHDELRRDCSSGRLFAEGLSLALIGYLHSRYGAPTSTRTLGKLSQRDLSKITAYVEANLIRNIGIADLASLLSLSNSQFSRLFKTTVGVSPYRYLQQKRVERAVELMRGPDSLAQIAQSVGLSNQSHFTQVFRQVTGVTPARARSSGI